MKKIRFVSIILLCIVCLCSCRFVATASYMAMRPINENDMALIECTDEKGAEKAIANGANIYEMKTKAGKQGTMAIAMFYGNDFSRKYLLEKGADPNASEFLLNITPLMKYADNEEQYDFCKLLIEKGADVNARSKKYPEGDYITALSAAISKSKKMINLFLDNGAEVNLKNLETLYKNYFNTEVPEDYIISGEKYYEKAIITGEGTQEQANKNAFYGYAADYGLLKRMTESYNKEKGGYISDISPTIISILTDTEEKVIKKIKKNELDKEEVYAVPFMAVRFGSDIFKEMEKAGWDITAEDPYKKDALEIAEEVNNTELASYLKSTGKFS